VNGALPGFQLVLIGPLTPDLAVDLLIVGLEDTK
jgi:hypothetical protein